MAAIALAALTAGAIGAATAVLLAGGDEPDFAVAPVTTRTVAETVVETIVTAPEIPVPSYIPETFRDKCNDTAPPTPDFDGSFVCRLGGPVEVVRYSHAESGRSMSAHLRRRLEEVGLPSVGLEERIDQQGSCEEQLLPGVEQFVASGRAGHDAVGTVPSLADDGRVVCYESGGKAHIEWTNRERNVYAHAYGPSYSPLLRWWRASAGPNA